MIEYSKVRKKFGWNDICPYIEISKPKLRNNLNQLFAMKNSILILCLLFAGVASSQEIVSFVKKQTFESFEYCVDSIAIYKVSDQVYNNLFRFMRAHKFRKHETFNDSDVVREVSDNNVTQFFTSKGVYAIQCFINGQRYEPSFLHVDDRYINSGSEILSVGHRYYAYYYIE